MTLFERIKRNPVLITGFVLSVLTGMNEVYIVDGGLTLATAVPVLATLVTRMFTVPKSEVIDLDELVKNDPDGGANFDIVDLS